MSRTLTVEGDLATVDLSTNITTQGSVTAPSRRTPNGANAIKHIVCAASAEGLADGSAVFFMRLGGSAVRNGEQTLMISAGGRIAVQSGSDAAPAQMPANIYYDVDIAVNQADTVDIAAEMAGSDLGTGHVVITLIFGNATSFKQYRSREGEATAVDTKTQLTTLGSQTAPGALAVPAGVSRLLGIIVAASGNYAAATGASGLVRLEGAGLLSGSEVIGCHAQGVPVATGGNSTTPAKVIPLDVPIVEGQEILIFGEMTGTDVGQISFGATLIFG